MSEDPRNKYRDVLITAKRARQLQGGASPQVTSKSMKVCRVAQEELAAGKIDADSVGYKIASEVGAADPANHAGTEHEIHEPAE